MTHTITFAHFKGGTGKTTSCASIAGFLAKHGAKVLAIDLDPQSNLTSSLGIDHATLKHSTFHVMSKRRQLKEVIKETGIDNLHVAPATPYLVHTSKRKYEKKDEAHILKDALKDVKKSYDYVLIDTPPSNGHFIVNGVTAADSVVLVMDPGLFALDGINTFNTVFKSYCNKLGLSFNIAMALVTRHRKNFNPFKQSTSKEVKEFAQSMLDRKVFLIPHSDHIHDAQKKGIPISHHKPYSNVGAAYMKVAEEIIKEG